MASLSDAPAPRVIIAMPNQWPRALLRAALREIGYDAIGTRTLADILRRPFSIDDVVRAVSALVPLPPGRRVRVDDAERR